MACKVSLLIKGEQPITVLEGVDPSTSLNTILETISSWDAVEIQNLQDKLKNVQGNLNYQNVIEDGRWLIGTTSFSELRELFPDELKDLEDNNYNITLLDNKILAGQTLKGRVNIDGKILYIFSNKKDVKQFARTEKLRKYIEQYNEDFPDNIKIIAKSYNKTVKELLLDFIYNKNLYYTDIKQGLVVYDDLQNFCKQLLNESIYIDESETQFAKYIRILNSSKSKFKKLDLYKAFSEFFPNFNISEEEFLNYNVEEINKLFSKYLQDDIIMSNYEVINVSNPNIGKTELSDILVQELYQKLKGDRDISLEEAKKLGYEFFPKTIELYGKTRNLLIQKNKFYYEIRIPDKEYIVLKNNKRSISEIFGYSTLSIFSPAVHPKISEKGEYKGYYIYKGKDEYIITNSAIHPDSFPYKRCKTVDEAITIINKFNPRIEHAFKGVLKNDFLRQVKLPFNVILGQTISSINYRIPRNFVLPPEKFKLLKGTVKDVLEFYKIPELNDLSAEQLGIFIYEESSTHNDYKTIINKIKSLTTNYYLIDKIKDNQTIYLTQIPESAIFNEGTKLLGTEKNFIDSVKQKQLEDLKSYFSNTIFKNTPIKIEIYSTTQIGELKNDKGQKLINNPEKVKAFVYNNNIYINQDLASAEDLIHEALHIMFGVLKVKGLYNHVIENLHKKEFYNPDIFMSEEYKNLPYIDKLEEAIVSYIADSIYGSHSFNADLGIITNTMEKWFFEVINKKTHKQQINDLSFNTSLQNIETGETLIKNRTLTNLIQLAIEKKKIIEKCQ